MEFTYQPTLIVNITIGVMLGITLAPVANSLLKTIFKLLTKPILRLLVPLRFEVFCVSDQIDIDANIFPKFQTIPWSTGCQFNTTGVDIKFCIKPEVTSKFFHHKISNLLSYSLLEWLYPPQDMQIQISHDSKSFEVTGNQPLPGKPIRYLIDEVKLKPRRIYHRSLGIRPREHFRNEKIKVKIYYQGKQYDSELFISLQTSS